LGHELRPFAFALDIAVAQYSWRVDPFELPVDLYQSLYPSYRDQYHWPTPDSNKRGPGSTIEEPLRVFISYCRADEAHAEKLYEQLNSLGIEPWMDRKKILPGMEWEAKIADAIGNSDTIIIMLSTASVDKRGYFQAEIKKALSV